MLLYISMPKNILLAYISEISGHRSAADAIEKALKILEPSTNILSINLFNYTNPYSEKVINRLYTSVIKRMPKIWEYLYDNPKVIKKTRGVKNIIHKFNSKKIKNLFDRFNPDAIICTQAFPCGMFADFKKIYSLNTLLLGIVTDFFPHTYWAYDNVDYYIVATEEARLRFIEQGIESAKIKLLGIPIDPKFAEQLNRKQAAEKLGIDLSKPAILVMGGGQGLGPIKTIVKSLNALAMDLQLIVVAGTNKKLYKKLDKFHFNKKRFLFKYIHNIDELMEVSSIMVTKPGGLSISEALAKGLVPVIVRPIPGQEENNTKYLTKHNAAFRIKNAKDISVVVGELLSNRRKYDTMRLNAKSIARPKAALEIAQLILGNV